MEIKRIGMQAPSIGWFAEGTLNVKVPMELGRPDNPSDSLLVAGEGFGKAGFDASGGACVDLGGWPIEYNAFGFFDVPKCELALTIEEVWPQTEARAACMGRSGSYSGGPYKLSFTNIVFTANRTRVDTETNKDMLSWSNTFRLFPGEGLEDAGCIWSSPP